jgi:hypothetical protein
MAVTAKSAQGDALSYGWGMVTVTKNATTLPVTTIMAIAPAPLPASALRDAISTLSGMVCATASAITLSATTMATTAENAPRAVTGMLEVMDSAPTPAITLPVTTIMAIAPPQLPPRDPLPLPPRAVPAQRDAPTHGSAMAIATAPAITLPVATISETAPPPPLPPRVPLPPIAPLPLPPRAVPVQRDAQTSISVTAIATAPAITLPVATISETAPPAPLPPLL